jgi:hypothetical protein
MKTMLLPTFLVGAGALLGALVRADDAPPLPPPPPDLVVPAPPDVKALPHLPLVPDLAPLMSDLHRQLQGQLSQVGSVMQDVMTLVPGLAGGDAYARQAARPGRTLVLPSGAADARENMGNAEEDLNVMARILEKALAAGAETDDRRAMGIAISSLGSPPSAPRNLYLEGYGAVFFLDVSFPLLPPPKKSEEARAKAPVSSEWEEARRELDAARSPEPRVTGVFRNSLRGGAEYDSDKVDRLKDDLLESLRNASHIRDLKPEESVTVVVTGTSGIRAQRFVARKGGGEGRNARNGVEEYHHEAARAPGARGETTMTVRVKKSDAEAFAAGKLNLEEFRKRATVRTY